MSNRRQVAYLIGFSAPPVLHLDHLIRPMVSNGWDTYIILSPTAAKWVDQTMLTEISGQLVRTKSRLPTEQNPLPHPDVVIAAPLTFNSLNKWAAGINDNLALGVLNESLGLDTTVIVAPYVKTELRSHPAYNQSIDTLLSANVTVLNSFEATPGAGPGPPTPDWSQILSTIDPAPEATPQSRSNSGSRRATP